MIDLETAKKIQSDYIEQVNATKKSKIVGSELEEFSFGWVFIRLLKSEFDSNTLLPDYSKGVIDKETGKVITFELYFWELVTGVTLESRFNEIKNKQD
ncbi:hypothetical protein [Bernardetia sp.]|uniref:hypothetical protein n=1 Tax=Bernardetia sp. TaxID=1937974 RepID=UPI0025B94624|nr:hypothetical protein [Bernardetia sp.]